MQKLRTNVRVTEVDSVSDALVRLYKEACKDAAVAADTVLSTVMAEIEALSADITNAINRDAVVSTLKAQDKKRDEAIRALKRLLNGYASFPHEAKRVAAGAVLDIVVKYGAITDESYASESSLIESLLADLAASSLAGAIAELDGVSDLVAALRAAQDEFNTANDERTAALAAKGKSASAIKPFLLGAINEKLVPYLSTLATLQESYAALAAKVGAEIGKANAAVAKRAKAGKNTLV